MTHQRPNILVMVAHDAGRHFGCYGIDTVRTPAIDALAGDGCRFTGVYATAPVCSPSRGSLFTGRYPQSNGLMGLVHAPWEWDMNRDERHLSRILRDAGYHTALFGFQHETRDVSTLGFAECRAAFAGDTRPNAVDVAAELERFLRDDAHRRTPFYAQVGFYETHRPFDFGGAEPDASLGVSVPPYLEPNDAAKADLAGLQGSLRQLDDAVGRIVAALEASGQAEETIVVFTVDHGIEVPRAKWFLYDPGIEIAFVMRWPAGGIAGGQTCDRLLSNVDALPTLLDLAGVPVPGNVEGASFAGALRGDGPATRDAIFALFQDTGNVGRCVRTANHKLIRTFTPRRQLDVPIDITRRRPRLTQPVVDLFDLDRDPHEFRSVADDPDYASVRRTLSDRLWAWLEAVDDPILRGPVPTPTYRAAMADYAAFSARSRGDA